MANQEKVFAKGFNFKRSDNAPEWAIGKLSIKVSDAIEFIKQNQSNDWVNLNILQGKQGNYYVELDTWKPENKQNQNDQKFNPTPEKSDDLPL